MQLSSSFIVNMSETVNKWRPFATYVANQHKVVRCQYSDVSNIIDRFASKKDQEAQLLQRDRTTPRVIEYFAIHSTSFTMTGLSRACVLCKYTLHVVFHWNYLCVSYRFWDIQRQIMAWPLNRGKWSFKVIENGSDR